MSELPKIETFESDIALEIKNKEANIGVIASSSGATENNDATTSNNRGITFVILSIIILLISVTCFVFYLWHTQNKNNKQDNLNKIIKEVKVDNNKIQLPETTNTNIGRFIINNQKTIYGYDLTINEYTSVFAFMIKNENLIKDDLSKLFNTTIDSNTWNDTTISNQNMRVLSDASSSIVYSFVNSEHLLLSTSTDGILRMRSAIIK